jgi:hypothetical protein
MEEAMQKELLLLLLLLLRAKREAQPRFPWLLKP